jgi:predicted MFS family arabinose efflux permease
MQRPVTSLALALLAIFGFQAANMGLFAFIIGLGQQAGLSLDFITLTLAVSGWIGIAGAVMVVLLDTKFGRTLPLTASIGLTAVGFLILHSSHNEHLFFWANCAMGITWAFAIPYLLGLVAAFDDSGQAAALGGFASKMGLASGPLVAGIILGGGGDEDYGLLINVSILVLGCSLIAVLYPSLRQDVVLRTKRIDIET